MIESFRSATLERYFQFGDSSGLPFYGYALVEVADILIDLASAEFEISDFERLWTITHHTQCTSAVVTVNGVESVGAITFNFYKSSVFNVDFYCEA